MNKLTTGIFIAGVAVTLGLAAQQGYDKAEASFKAAYEKEVVDGDLKSAIAQYEKLARGGNRAVAAKALVRIGQCHEKLGSAEARKAYERVVREFGDQKEAAAEARQRLNTRTTAGAGMTARRIERPAGVQERVYDASRDGRFLVCKGPGEIYLRSLETGEKRVVLKTGSGQPHQIRLSPDGLQLAYIMWFGPDGPPAELHVVRSDGSGRRAYTAKDLGGNPRRPTLWDWTPDGQSVLLIVGSADGKKGKLALVRASSGAVQDLGSAEAMSFAVYQARVSPDGRFIAFTRPGGPGYMGNGISVRTLDGSQTVSLSPDGTYPLWSPDGKRVLFTSNRRGPTDLWAIPVSGGKPAGPAELVREGLDNPIALTRDGELFYTTTIEVRDIYSIDIDVQTGQSVSKPVKLTHRYVNAGAAWSPDGKQLAYASLRDGREPGAGEPASLVIRTITTGQERVVTPNIGLDMNLANPQWFPDSRSLLIQPQWGPRSGRLAKVDTISGAVELLDVAPSAQTAGTWYDSGATLSPDGLTLYYTPKGPKPGQVRIMRREIRSGEERELGIVNVVNARGTHVAVSPDGRRLTFWADRTLMIMPSSGGEATPIKTGNVVRWGAFQAWSPDGKRIYFPGLAKPGDPGRNPQCEIWSVGVEGGEPVPVGLGLHTIWSFHIHPDGNRIVFYDEFYPDSELWSLKNLPGIR